MAGPQLHIGCSGYFYQDWKGAFYPRDLPKKRWLAYYAQQFDALEINHTFYRIPKKEKMQDWYEKTPEQFRFAIKGNRYMTQLKKLKMDEAARDSLSSFFTAIEPLKEKAGPVLWQCPGNLKVDLERLETFCSLLPRDYPHVIEFRNKDWFRGDVYEILEKHGVAWCNVSAPGNIPQELHITSEMAYIRFHGHKTWYQDAYPDPVLERWSNALKEATGYTDLWAFFNNTDDANAARNALTFADIWRS